MRRKAIDTQINESLYCMLLIVDEKNRKLKEEEEKLYKQLCMIQNKHNQHNNYCIKSVNINTNKCINLNESVPISHIQIDFKSMTRCK